MAGDGGAGQRVARGTREERGARALACQYYTNCKHFSNTPLEERGARAFVSPSRRGRLLTRLGSTGRLAPAALTRTRRRLSRRSAQAPAALSCAPQTPAAGPGYRRLPPSSSRNTPSSILHRLLARDTGDCRRRRLGPMLVKSVSGSESRHVTGDRGYVTGVRGRGHGSLVSAARPLPAPLSLPTRSGLPVGCASEGR